MAFAVAALAQNIAEKCPDLDYDYVIFADGFSENDVAITKRLGGSRIILRNYSQIDFENTFDIDLAANDEDFVFFIRRFSFLALSKPLVFTLLRTYKKALLLDVDTFMLKDISELFEKSGIQWRAGNMRFHHKLKHATLNIPDFNKVNENTPVPNGGVIFMADDIPYEKMLADAIFLIKHHYKELTALDEVSISWAVVANDVVPVDFGIKYNCLPPWELPDTSIIHTVGDRKIWNDPILKMAFSEWWRHYNKWLACGGSPFKKPMRQNIFSDRRGLMIEQLFLADIWRNILLKNDFVLPAGASFDYNFVRHWLPIFITGWGKGIYYEFRIFNPFHKQELVVSLQVREASLQKDERLIALLQGIVAAEAAHSDIFKFVKGNGFYAIDSAVIKHSDAFSIFTTLIKRTRSIVSLHMDEVQAEIT